MLVAVGKNEHLRALEVLGFDVNILPSEYSIEEVLSKILGARVALVEEDVYRSIESRLRRVSEGQKYPPLIVVIPSEGSEATHRLKDLYELLSRAVGVKLKVKGP